MTNSFLFYIYDDDDDNEKGWLSQVLLFQAIEMSGGLRMYANYYDNI